MVDLKEYLTQEEQDKYIKSYIEEGEFSGDGSLKIFPTAKSTEIFMLNKTDWNKFAEATGADLNDLKTIEGVTKTAQAYYEWTDSQTKKNFLEEMQWRIIFLLVQNSLVQRFFR